MKNEWPRVIRPDLLITEHGLSVTELDSVPGGIGLTAWLNQAYSQMGFNVAGGAQGIGGRGIQHRACVDRFHFTKPVLAPASGDARGKA